MPGSAGALGPAGSFGGTGSASGQFNQPLGVVAGNGQVLVADEGNARVQVFGASSPWAWQSSVALSPPTGFAPTDVALAPSNTLYAAGATRVDGWPLGINISWAPPGSSYGIAATSDPANPLGSLVYVSDAQGGVIRKYTGTGQAGTPATIGAGQLVQPQGMTSDASGSIYVADPGAGKVLKFSSAGSLQAQWTMPTYTIVAGGSTATGRIEPHDVAVDGSSRVYVPDAGTHSNLVAVFAADGALQALFGSPDSDPGNPCQLRVPRGIAISNGTVYVASTGENRVRVFDGSASPCPSVSFGSGGGITPPPSGGAGGAKTAVTDQSRPSISFSGSPGSGAARGRTSLSASTPRARCSSGN